jgi:steroid 5-alpha reductase family enzyme
MSKLKLLFSVVGLYGVVLLVLWLVGDTKSLYFLLDKYWGLLVLIVVMTYLFVSMVVE